MELTNSTSQDTRYKVTSSGGSGIAAERQPFNREEPRNWPTLARGAHIPHHPSSPGPWIVYFMINGHQCTGLVSSDSAKVTLVEDNGSFKVTVN